MNMKVNALKSHKPKEFFETPSTRIASFYKIDLPEGGAPMYSAISSSTKLQILTVRCSSADGLVKKR